jgi:hypothetical protein
MFYYVLLAFVKRNAQKGNNNRWFVAFDAIQIERGPARGGHQIASNAMLPRGVVDYSNTTVSATSTHFVF